MAPFTKGRKAWQQFCCLVDAYFVATKTCGLASAFVYRLHIYYFVWYVVCAYTALKRLTRSILKCTAPCRSHIPGQSTSCKSDEITNTRKSRRALFGFYAAQPMLLGNFCCVLSFPENVKDSNHVGRAISFRDLHWREEESIVCSLLVSPVCYCLTSSVDVISTHTTKQTIAHNISHDLHGKARTFHTIPWLCLVAFCSSWRFNALLDETLKELVRDAT